MVHHPVPQHREARILTPHLKTCLIGAWPAVPVLPLRAQTIVFVVVFRRDGVSLFGVTLHNASAECATSTGC